MRFAVAVLMLVGTSVAADTKIHRCLLDDGTVAFQEMPCPDVAEDTNDGNAADETPSDSGAQPSDDDVFDFVNPYDEPAGAPTSSRAALPEAASQDRAECEESTRDAIDAIDLEMRENAYSKDQGEAYLTELLALTQQLRACKQL